MTEHFIDYIKIKHYKCFDDFSAEGFKRVNLIGGRNNVGKTALVEALLISASSQNVQQVMFNLDWINFFRKQADDAYVMGSLFGDVKNISREVVFFTNHNHIKYKCNAKEIPRQYTVQLNNESIEITENSLAEVVRETDVTSMRVAYISSLKSSQKDIIRSFIAIQKKDKEPEVDRIIQQFDSSIENIKVIGGESIQCKVVGSSEESSYRDISEFGDGLRHYISIIADLFFAENGHIILDEIDNGIHYSSLNDLWEIILTLSQELNVQVFATTHSKECIEAYCRAAEKLQDKDITFTTLVRNKEKQVKAIVRDYDVFTDSINDEREVRGW